MPTATRLSLGARDPKAASDALGAHDQARVMTARFDALDVDSARQWIEATAERFGRIDGLINNAGILRMVRFDEGDEAAMNEMWSVNVMAPFRLLRLALPHLRRRAMAGSSTSPRPTPSASATPPRRSAT